MSVICRISLDFLLEMCVFTLGGVNDRVRMAGGKDGATPDFLVVRLI